ncbi:lanthionine synthetase C family protein [Labedaea rhizosphaerae]|uniref:Lanthionine synthetase-like protein n=1 Tax=Labedaea rhizosphaerae TaxID=598644 RepID=A0A4V3CZR1_LABRH|nr:lanthionine synthetase C family protein [Labedaea rhizosphaerae]TDQ00651.1 lanthionine synthetase-like protein [Labedaea rhizosphaerae]
MTAYTMATSTPDATPTATAVQADSLVHTLATALATPPSGPADTRELAGREQSLDRGTAGIALLHVERALTGTGSWSTAHAWIRAATACDISAADDTGLYLGAPAIAFLLHAANSDNIDHAGRYHKALSTLDAHVEALAHRRVDAATARLDRGESTSFADYDVIRGLTGIGRLLLYRAPAACMSQANALSRVLRYLIRLTHPRSDGRPGWWVDHHPDPALPTPGGHANHGLAHGIAGVLAFLGTALRRGVTVDGHHDAIATLGAHLDHWQQDNPSQTTPNPAGPLRRNWWPTWITHDDIHTGHPLQPGPPRPSWCYGTPGIVRALQIAAIATGDTARQRRAEHVLVGCISDSHQLAHLSDVGLCHGWAGLYQTVWRAAQDATTSDLPHHLPNLTTQLTRQASQYVSRPTTRPGDPTFLTGTAGLALALHTATHNTAPRSGWDACLLIN